MKPVSLERKITVKENKKSQPPVRFQDILMSDQLHCSIYLTPFLHSFRVIMKKLYFQVYICSILANNALTSSEVSSRTITEGKECSQCKQNKKKKAIGNCLQITDQYICNSYSLSASSQIFLWQYDN